jgi:zinc protease
VPRLVKKEVVEPVELAKVSMGWITPPAYSKDATALEVAAAVLAGGKATRLYEALVVKKRLASEVEAELDPNALGGIFAMSAVAASGKPAAEVERAIDEVIGELGRAGPTEAELQRAKRRLLVGMMAELQLLNGRDGESGRAGLLQRFNHYLGDPGQLAKWPAALSSVTASEVADVVRRQLPLDRRVVVTTTPKKPAARPSPAKGAKK